MYIKPIPLHNGLSRQIMLFLITGNPPSINTSVSCNIHGGIMQHKLRYVTYWSSRDMLTATRHSAHPVRALLSITWPHPLLRNITALATYRVFGTLLLRLNSYVLHSFYWDCVLCWYGLPLRFVITLSCCVFLLVQLNCVVSKDYCFEPWPCL